MAAQLLLGIFTIQSVKQGTGAADLGKGVGAKDKLFHAWRVGGDQESCHGSAAQCR